MKLIEIAKAHQLYILCDEVYQGLSDDEVSISDLYDLGIATSSLSKITSYAGLRIGWIKANHKIIKMINDRRDYHIISTGYINDYLATIVVENYDKILKRSRKIIETNRQSKSIKVIGPDGTIYSSIKDCAKKLNRNDKTIKSWIERHPELGYKYYNN